MEAIPPKFTNSCTNARLDFTISYTLRRFGRTQA